MHNKDESTIKTNNENIENLKTEWGIINWIYAFRYIERNNRKGKQKDQIE